MNNIYHFMSSIIAFLEEIFSSFSFLSISSSWDFLISAITLSKFLRTPKAFKSRSSLRFSSVRFQNSSELILCSLIFSIASFALFSDKSFSTSYDGGQSLSFFFSSSSFLSYSSLSFCSCAMSWSSILLMFLYLLFWATVSLMAFLMESKLKWLTKISLSWNPDMFSFSRQSTSSSSFSEFLTNFWMICLPWLVVMSLKSYKVTLSLPLIIVTILCIWSLDSNLIPASSNGFSSPKLFKSVSWVIFKSAKNLER